MSTENFLTNNNINYLIVQLKEKLIIKSTYEPFENLLEIECLNFEISENFLCVEQKDSIKVFEYNNIKSNFKECIKEVVNIKTDCKLKKMKLQNKLLIVQFVDFTMKVFSLTANTTINNDIINTDNINISNMNEKLTQLKIKNFETTSNLILLEFLSQTQIEKILAHRESTNDVKNIKIFCINTFELMNEVVDVVDYKLGGEFFVLIKKDEEKFEVEIFYNFVRVKGFLLEKYKECEIYWGEKNILLSITANYVAGSYYGDSSLYSVIINTINNNLDVNLDNQLNNKNNQKKYNCELKTINNINKILSITSTDNFYAIIFGPNPSKILFLDKISLKPLKTQKTSESKNFCFFSQNFENQINAGLNNLSGLITVYNSNELTSQFKRVGASVIEFFSDSNYFLVGITNKLRVDNQIEIIDLYGNVLFKNEFEELLNVKIWKLNEYEKYKTQQILQKPEKMKIESLDKKKFVFSLNSKSNINTNKVSKSNTNINNINNNKVNKKIIPVIEQPKTIFTREEINNTLEKIKNIKLSRDEGKELNINDVNLILKEKKFKKMLEELDG